MRKGIRRRLIVAFLLALSCWVAAWLAARMLIVNAPLERADAIVVLSGSSAFAERTQLAARLYAAGYSSRVVLTNDNRQGGWLSSEQRNPFFYERARWELERLGVPSTSIEVIGTPVQSTQEEALVVSKYADSNGLQSILIVTSAYHSRRALRTFRRVMKDRVTVGLVAVPPGWQTPNPSTWWLTSHGWQTVPGEYLKLIAYELRGWL
ncbi:MAG: YdcF family protein [Pyrinomonadaceae bacterium]